MSQKTKMLGVKHKGASVYLGNDSWGNPMWTRSPDRIMDWLCNGWRFRFNQFRAQRTIRTYPENLTEGQPTWVDTPMGGVGTSKPEGDRITREKYTWLKSVPSRILQSPEKIEDLEWFSSLKRKKVSGGRVPGFRSRSKSPQVFTCTYVEGETGNFNKVSKHTGTVTISGRQPKSVSKDGCAWSVTIRIRLSQPIRKYTSVKVNWSSQEVTFVNKPLPIPRLQTGSEVGIDRGVVHTLATSNGEFFDIPKEAPDKYKSLQKKLSRQAKGSNRRAKTLTAMNKIKTNEVARRTDWIHKTTTTLVKEHDVIVLEDLKVPNMVRKGKHKRGLNRSILESNWGQFQSTLSYKANLAGVKVTLVNPAYTSQECNLCHYTSRENRESQSVFKCQECGHRANADTNAARNILDRGTGHCIGLGRGGKIRLTKASAKESASGEASTAAIDSETERSLSTSNLTP